MKSRKERTVERPFHNHVEKDGSICLKIGNSGRRGYPDRLVLMPNNGHFFIELKKQGEAPSKYQHYIHSLLRDLGHTVHWSDSKQAAIAIYENEKIIQG